jgi:adenosylhomocysteine nucleosidase
MKTLIITPRQAELDFFAQGCTRRGFKAEQSMAGRLPVVSFPQLGITLAPGGFGKVQFAVQTQYLLALGTKWDRVVCAGAAGGLSDSFSIGDVVVATSTVEHDFNNRFGPRLLPKFDGSSVALAELRGVAGLMIAFKVHFGTLASGDEAVIGPEQQQLLQEATGVVAVAWEGVGGARACTFNSIPFVEIRGITNPANADASLDFETNLELVMNNVATLITDWVEQA